MGEAILESKYPSYSVFASTSPLPLTPGFSQSNIQDVIALAQVTLQNRPATYQTCGDGNTTSASNSTATFSSTATTSSMATSASPAASDSPAASSACYGGSPLLQDAAAGDPASLGVTVILSNFSTSDAQVNGEGYGAAATAQLDYLLYDVPRGPNGAISHRTDQFQAWSDFIYMVPPFLAYYGAVTNNQTLLEEAYNQVSAYRGILGTDNGLWRHILDGTGTTDSGLWLTGNGWAAAGMLRVLATMKWSQFSSNLQQQQSDLQNWVEAIMSACQSRMTSKGLLPNYLDDASSFGDTAGSTLIAYAGYRLSTLNLTSSYTNMSSILLGATSAHVNSSGFLTDAVDPLNWSKQGSESPEGQSFMVMAYAAYDAWVSQGQQGDAEKNPLEQSAAGRTAAVSAGVALGLAALGAVWTSL